MNADPAARQRAEHRSSRVGLPDSRFAAQRDGHRHASGHDRRAERSSDAFSHVLLRTHSSGG
ncbi:MAG: hypothetical protein HC933_10390 [Pleurocapsa sp. SU_196_0]|nr:hypothetical protein [Pleurocapsa sp. SU_196_0]